MKEYKKKNIFRIFAKLNESYFITVLLTLFVFMVTSYLCHLYPFGDNSLLTWDGNTQYLNFYGYLQDVLNGKNDILYSFSNVLGGGMLGLEAYYLFSPYNLIFACFKKESLILAVHVVALLKYISASMAFCVYLNGCYKENYALKALISVCYGYIGYTVSYYMILNWLDGVILLPLIAFGLHRLLYEKRPSLYIVTLASAIIFNYYIGFMLCAASAIFFIIRVTMLSKSCKKIFLNNVFIYVISSMLAGGISAVVILPVINSLPLERVQLGIKELMHFDANFNFFDFFTKLFSCSTNAQQVGGGLPIVFIGIFPFLLVILFFINKNVKHNYKIIAIIVLLIFFFSFHNRTINILWHGMTINSSFNYRYSFIFSFICLVIAFDSFCHLGELETIDYEKCGLLMLSIILFVFNSIPEYISVTLLYLDFALIITMIILFIFIHKKIRLNFCKFILIFVVILNITENNVVTFNNLNSGFGGARYSEYKVFCEQLSEVLERVPKDFYRTEKTFSRTIDDNMLLGINGVTNYSSVENIDILNFVYKLGLTHTWMWASYNYNDYNNVPKATDSILGIKYLISDDLENEKNYILLDNINNYGIYQNPYVLPIIMPADTIIESIQDDMNSFEILNSYWRSLAKGFKGNIFCEQEKNEYTNVEERRSIIQSNIVCQDESSIYIYTCREIQYNDKN